jgi:anti-sigma factor RsiW
MDGSGQLCARARFWASLRIDGELSELEGALLDAHLARCAECRAVAADFAAETGTLRAARLERPEPVMLPSRRPARRLLATALIAAVVVLGAIAGGLVRGDNSPSASRAPHIVAAVAMVDTPDQLRRLRRTTLLNQRPAPHGFTAEPV